VRNAEREETLDEYIERLGIKPPKPKAPALTLAASKDRRPKEQSQVASVALQPRDVQTVRDALAHRRMIIGGDVVGFEKVTEARVTMRWTRPTPAIEHGAGVVSAYNPFAKERLPGYEGDDD
jgi:hypothetical protein